MELINHSIPHDIVRLKSRYKTSSGGAFLSEVLPLAYSKEFPLETKTLDSLHLFARTNSLYVNSYDLLVGSIPCLVYEADINGYWLSSKKHDSCYQPFYPTWLLSAFALAHVAKSLGYSELVDIGSGDGRIAYCGELLGMDSYGIEIDKALVRLQRKIAASTNVSYKVIEADATRNDYDKLKLSRPIFFISGLPEMGEMLAHSVLRKILANPSLGGNAGFNFTGSHVMKNLSRDHTYWGWGRIISQFGLKLNGTITLPTYWTTEERLDTAYVFAESR